MDLNSEGSDDQLLASQEQLAALEDTLSDKNTQIIQLNTELTEHKLKIRELNYKIEVMEMEKSNKDTPTLDKINTEFTDIESPLHLLETIIESQREEISSLMDGRTNLVTSFKKMNLVLSKNENFLTNYLRENNYLKESLEEQKEDRKIEKIASNTRWKKALQKVREILPSNIKLSEDFEQIPPEEALVNIVDSLLEYSNLIAQSANSKATSDFEKLKRQHSITVGHLKNLVDFVKKLSGSLPNVSNARKDIVVECGRISAYIDTEEACGMHSEMSSIFEIHDEVHNLEDLAKLVLRYIEDDKRSDIPYEEILLLITTILQVNKMLYNQNQILRQVKQMTPSEFPRPPVADFDQTEELKKISRQYDDLNTLVINTLAPFIPDPQNSAEDILKQFKTTARFSTKEERQEVAKHINQLEFKLDRVTKELDVVNERYEEEKKIFCDKATHILNAIHRRVAHEINKKDILIKEQKSQLERYIQENTAFRTNSASQRREVNQEIRSRDDKISDLSMENECLKKELEETRSSLTITTEESSQLIANLKASNADLEERSSSLEKGLEKQREKHKFYKTKLIEMTKQNSDALNDACIKNQKITEKYDSTIQALESDLESVKVQNVDFKQQIDEFATVKQNLMMRIAKHQVTERSLNLKVQSLNDTIERIKHQYEGRIATISQLMEVNSKNQVENLNKAIERAMDVLNFILKKEFKIEEVDAEQTLDDLLKIVTQKFQERSLAEDNAILADAIETRKIIGLSRPDSLKDAFKRMIQEFKDIELDIEKTVKENENLVSKISTMENELSKSNHVRLENAEWEKWIRTLYVQVIGVHDDTLSIAVAKRGLHEYILSLIKQESLFRKLEILRTEKRAILKQKSLVTAKLPRCTYIPSTRPFMMAFIFLRRTQMMSGTLQSSVLSKAAGADFTTSKLSRRPLIPVK